MSSEPENPRGLKLVAHKDFAGRDDMYEIVDFLNKSLKGYDLMFGLRKTDKGQMTITVYEV
ncbi:MAG: YpmA family protein [Bacillota bacterium]|nr:YpmA family protein [Bacillota bacterium]